MNVIGERIRQKRLQQPLPELERKRNKAWRREYWTQEDIDYVAAAAKEIAKDLRWTPEHDTGGES